MIFSNEPSMKFLLYLFVVPCVICTCTFAQTSEPYTWKPVPIVGGGFVTGIITHPTEKNLIYIRTDVGGAYRWDTASGRWIPLTDWIDADHWSDTGIESIAIDPGDPNRVYMAVGTYVTNWAPITGAILRSGDRGKTWQRTDLPFRNGGNEPGRSMGERLVVDPADGNVLFFGSRGAGLWKSTDRAVTWQQVKSFPAIATASSASTGGQWSRPLGIVFVQFDPKDTKKIYAGVGTKETSIYRSIDGGATWSAMPNQPVGLRPNHIAISSNDIIYISYGDDSGPNTMTDGAIWKLDPSTDTWTNITPEKPTTQRKFGYGSVCVDAPNPLTVMAGTFCRYNGGDDIYRSSDGGKTWKSLKEKSIRDSSAAPWLRWGNPEAPFGHWIGDVEIDPHDSSHALYTIGWGVWSTNDLTNVDSGQSAHWTFTQGIEECVVNNIVSPPAGAHLLSVMWDIDGFRHEDVDVSPPEGFFKPATGKDSDIDFAEKNSDIVARVFYGNNTHGALSTDNGKTWTMFAAAAQGNGGGDIAVSADGATLISTPENSAPQVSHDHAATWKPCEGIPEKLRVVSDRVDPKLFYAFDPSSGAFYASADAGDHFARQAFNLPKANGFLHAVPDHAEDLFLATDQGIFYSKDAGVTFTKLAKADSAKRIGFGKAPPSQTYPAIYIIGKISNIYGFYRSDDIGQTWTRINDDQHQFGGVTCITGDPRIYGRVYIGSSNRGILCGDPRTNSSVK
jgi:xyloglucan-specific exo-beta-1,4-glucanase